MLQSKNNKLKELSSCPQCGKRARPIANINGATGWIFNLGSCKCAIKESQSANGAEPNGRFTNDKTVDDEPIPTEIDDQFEVLAVLGRGGMGTVYKVRSKETNAQLALKLIHSNLSKDAAAVKRFEQEAQAVAQLDHPNLVAVYGHGKTKSGESYLLMDFVEGESLSRVIEREGALDEPRAIEIFSQICAALSHAHEQNLVHRDIKPANIILSKTEDGEEIAKVVDFGIAKTLPSDDRETRDLTQTGEVFGSPHYMSPEQCLGFMLDQRSDIYSFGCLMYETLSGKPPFAGSNAIQLVVKHINDAAKPFVQQFNSTTRMKGLQAVILKCLEKEQMDRWQSIDEIFDALTRVRIGKSAYSFHSSRKNSQLMKGMLPIAWITPGIITVVGIGFMITKGISSIAKPDSLPPHIPDFPLLLLVPILLSFVFLFPAQQLSKISTDGRMPKLNAWSINSMFYSGVLFWGMIPFAMAVVFFPGEFLDVARLRISLPFIELFVLSGGLISIISMVATLVCAVGVFVDRGPKKVTIMSITPKVFFVSSLIILLFPFLFSKPSASVAAAIARLDCKLPVEITCGTANQLINYAVERNPNNMYVLDQAVFVSRETKHYSDTIKYCTAILKQPNFDESTDVRWARYGYMRAKAFERIGDFTNAIDYYSKEIESQPEGYEPRSERGRCFMKAQQFDKALADFDELIRLYPRGSTAYYLQAQAYLAKGLPEKVIESINQRMRLREGNTIGAHLWKAYAFEQTGNATLARQEFIAATTNDSKVEKHGPIIYMLRALAYHRLGQEKAVVEQLKLSKVEELYWPNWTNLDSFDANSFGFLPDGLQKQMKEVLVNHGTLVRE